MIYKAFKYRIYPSKEQRELIAKHIGCCRWVYNYALNKKISVYEETKKTLGKFDICDDLPKLKESEETCWLKEVNAQSLQASLGNLDKAYKRFFKEKKGFPKFKSKKDSHQSYTIPQNTKVNFDNNALKLPKFKKSIKCKFHRKFKGIIKSSTISLTPTNKYFVSILVEVDNELPNKKPISENQTIGVDLGIKTFATLSNGVKIDNPKYLRKSIKKLKVLQRKVSKKVKGSNNRRKSTKKLAISHERVVNQRLDFIHKTTHYLVNNYDTLCLETLKASNMLKNHKLAQALSDIAIGKFNDILNYKAEWYGCNILRIGQFEPSSKMCSCGIVNNELTLKDRSWTCKSCGTTHDRDILASNNIKKFALNTAGVVGFQACGDKGLPLSMKQETQVFRLG